MRNLATDSLLPSNENMKKIIFLPILFLLVACGPSGEEEQHTNETVKDTFFECRDAVIVVEHDKSMVTVINKNSGEHKHLFLEKDLREAKAKGPSEKYINMYVDETAMHNNFLPPTKPPSGYGVGSDEMTFDLRENEIGWLRVYFKGRTDPVYYRGGKCEQ